MAKLILALLTLPWLLLSPSLSAIPLPDVPAPFEGGTFTVGVPYYPPSLYFGAASDEITEAVDQLSLESLFEQNPKERDFLPLLANRWRVSKDHKTYTFWIRPEARFANGKPVRAEDVLYTVRSLKNEHHASRDFQELLRDVKGCRADSPLKVTCTSTRANFKILETLGTLFILPNQSHSEDEWVSGHFKKLVGSGPYQIQALVPEEQILLKKNAAYWGRDLPQNRTRFNFEKIRFRIVANAMRGHELLTNGDIDYWSVQAATTWESETHSLFFQKGWIKKLKIENEAPSPSVGIVWNLRRPLFREVRVRKALALLMNRELWMSTLFFDNYEPTAGLFARRTEFHTPTLLPHRYDPAQAVRLLGESGWKKEGESLVKNGKGFHFELLIDNPGLERVLAAYQQDLKKVGIQMDLRFSDAKMIRQRTSLRNFDARTFSHWRELSPSDFLDSWGSRAAGDPESQNWSGYQNAKLDRWAKRYQSSFSPKERLRLARNIEGALAQDEVVAWGWEPKFGRVLYWDRFSFAGKGYHRFSDWKDLFQYWWWDKEKEAALKKQKSLVKDRLG